MNIPLWEWDIGIQDNLWLLPLKGHIISHVVGLAFYLDAFIQELFLWNNNQTRRLGKRTLTQARGINPGLD